MPTCAYVLASPFQTSRSFRNCCNGTLFSVFRKCCTRDVSHVNPRQRPAWSFWPHLPRLQLRLRLPWNNLVLMHSGSKQYVTNTNTTCSKIPRPRACHAGSTASSVSTRESSSSSCPLRHFHRLAQWPPCPRHHIRALVALFARPR